MQALVLFPEVALDLATRHPWDRHRFIDQENKIKMRLIGHAPHVEIRLAPVSDFRLCDQRRNTAD